MEDKQLICDLLLPALQHTRNLEDLKSLTYLKDNRDGYEVVVVKFRNGSRKGVNVTMDSGLGMIRDIIKKIV